jgi:hypothetical protein
LSISVPRRSLLFSPAAAAAILLLASPLVAGSGSAAHAVPAPGTPLVTATVSPSALSSTGVRAFDLVLHIHHFGEAQTLGIEVSSNGWPGPRNGLGGPLAFGTPSMLGPGSVHLQPAPVPPLAAGACVRGVAYDFTLLSVALPAGSSTAVQLPVTAIVPAWPGTDYTPRVLLNFDRAGTEDVVAVPPVRMTGPTGFRIDLSTRPPASAIRTGRSVTITGKTSPAVRHAIVRVSVRSAPRKRADMPGRAHLVAIARTDGTGRFRVAAWRPPGAGDYQLLATIAHPGHGLMHDTTCPTQLYVRPHPASRPPHAHG